MNALTWNFLVSKFREYYIQASLEAPPGLASREWGFLFFDDSGMRRHKSFFSRGELVDYVRAMVPRHVYHSAAYYQRPGAPTMKEKIWQGADLIFDLDADHLRNAPKSYSEMLGLVKKETQKLLDLSIVGLWILRKRSAWLFRWQGLPHPCSGPARIYAGQRRAPGDRGLSSRQGPGHGEVYPRIAYGG